MRRFSRTPEGRLRAEGGTPKEFGRTLSNLTDTTSNRPSAGRQVAAFFDLDKTVIAKSSTLAFSRPFYDGGLINRRPVLKSTYAQFVFLLTAADHDQVEQLGKRVTDMCQAGTSTRSAPSSAKRSTKWSRR